MRSLTKVTAAKANATEPRVAPASQATIGDSNSAPGRVHSSWPSAATAITAPKPWAGVFSLPPGAMKSRVAAYRCTQAISPPGSQSARGAARLREANINISAPPSTAQSTDSRPGICCLGRKRRKPTSAKMGHGTNSISATRWPGLVPNTAPASAPAVVIHRPANQ